MHETVGFAIRCSKVNCHEAGMRKREETILFVLFCVGIIGGLLIPRWLFLNTKLDFGILNMDSFRQYTVLKMDYAALAREVVGSRLTLMFLLFFASYTAAGFWILCAVFLAFGLSLGFFAAVVVLYMKYWGILFWASALFPQWILYGMAAKKIVVFMQKRRERTALCNGNAVSAYNRATFLEFLKILGLTCLGMAGEVWVNPWVLQYFLNFYLR